MDPNYPNGPQSWQPEPRPPASDTAPRALSLGEALVGCGALLVIIFSFAPFVGYEDKDLLRYLTSEDLPTWFSAWSLETFLAPLTWWVIFTATGELVVVALRLGMPAHREIAGFPISHIQVGLSLFGFLVLAGYALSAKTLVYGSELQNQSGVRLMDGDLSFGWGGYAMLAGATIAVTGAFLDHLDIGSPLWPPQRRG